MKILVTCPPMLGMINSFKSEFEKHNFEFTAPDVVQTLSVKELCEIIPNYDGWIIGDDPATREVFEAGKSGSLKAAVKWGIGVDNVDFQACKDLDIPIINTPKMFGAEVADIAVGYLIGLARETFTIHEQVKKGNWPKPRGISLYGKKVALLGLGDIGINVAKRLSAMGMVIYGYDPNIHSKENEIIMFDWPKNIDEADFIVITCSLTKSSYHLINDDILTKVKKGVRIINVGRGGIIDEKSLENALTDGRVHSAALDVFEVEPLPMSSILRKHPKCIFGSHNASNTSDAVMRTSLIAIEKLSNFLGFK